MVEYKACISMVDTKVVLNYFYSFSILSEGQGSNGGKSDSSEGCQAMHGTFKRDREVYTCSILLIIGTLEFTKLLNSDN